MNDDRTSPPDEIDATQITTGQIQADAIRFVPGIGFTTRHMTDRTPSPDAEPLVGGEPQTTTGRETLADPYFAPPLTPFYDRLRERILAIEAEARRAPAPLVGGEPRSRETRVPPDLSDDPEGEHCFDCGKAVGVVWTAPDELWAAVTGRPDGGGLLCVRCFDRRAEAQRRFLRWVPQEEEPSDD